MRRPAAVADSFILVVLFQGVARAGAAEDAAAAPAVVPPPRHGKDALAPKTSLRGGVGDPELVFIGVGAHRFVSRDRAPRLFCPATQVVAFAGPGARSDGLVVLCAIKVDLCCCADPSMAAGARALGLLAKDLAS